MTSDESRARPGASTTPRGPADDAGAPDPGELGPTSTGLDPRMAAALAYLAWWLTGALFLSLEPTHRFVRFHARQALVVFGLVSVVGVALWLASLVAMFASPVLFQVTALLAPVVWGVGLALWAACVAQAARGKWWVVPIIGSWLAARDPRP